MLTLGLISTAGISEQTRRFGIQQHQSIETKLIGSIKEGLRSKVETNIAVLAAVAGWFNTTESEKRSSFKTFYETLDINTSQLNGVQGVGFTRWILNTQLPAFEQRMRQEGFANFIVRPPGTRANYSSIEFLEPFDWRNQRTFGYDMYSEPIRRQAMQRAVQTDQAVLSGKVRLVQEIEEDLQRGVLIYLPVKTFQGQQKESSQRVVKGWAYSPVRMSDLVNSVISAIDNTDIAGSGILIFDGAIPNPKDLLFDNLELLNKN